MISHFDKLLIFYNRIIPFLIFLYITYHLSPITYHLSLNSFL